MPVVAEVLESRRMLANVPDGFSDTQLTSGLFSPTSMAIAPDGRIFVTEQTGDVRVVKNGQLLTQPFAHVDVRSNGEHGLLGIVFDPDFSNNQFVYIYYTTPLQNGTFHNRLARFTANGDVAAGSATTLFDLDDLDASQLYHDGGGLHFGPDGKLYISVGENQHPENSQDLGNLEGKILRLNSDGSIPNDNPFFNTNTGNNRAIWALGFRNPFTFAFQEGTGLMYINDVGQDSYEEVNEGGAGNNYGWPQQEGQNGLGQNGITDPIYYYGHFTANAITGGVFYPGSGSFPSQYLGKYFFADIGGGFIRTMDTSTHDVEDFADNVGAPVDLDIGADGALYYLGRFHDGDDQDDSGFISIIRNTEAQPPSIDSQPSDKQVGVSQSATFTVSASGQAPLSFQWQRNGQDIPGANSASYTVDSATAQDDGAQFTVTISNNVGQVTSNAATLTVIDDTPPTPTILTPTVGTTFYAGQAFTYSGTASDEEDGAIPASGFTWQVDYHTGSVVRPFVQPTTGATTGSFVIPTITPYTKSNVFFRVILKVTDSNGLTATTTRDITPLTANITVKPNISSFIVNLDGQDTAAGGTTFNGVQGIARELNAPATQDLNGRTYVFDHWSDGGDIAHEISTPGKRYTYTAVYVPQVTKGLQGVYFNNKNFTGTQITRNDKFISFDFGHGKPDAAIARDTWAVRWNGKIQAADDDTYTFSIVTDGGVRLRVNGQIVINSLTPANEVRTLTGAIDLTGGGTKYPIVLEYIHDTGDASIDFRYSNSGNGEQTVPYGLLYFPTTVTNTFNPTADSYVQGGDQADTSFGDSTDLLVKSYKSADFQRDTYLRLDLSSLNVITSAKLRVFGRLSGVQNANVQLGVYSAGKASFTDSSLTYNNRPPLGTLQSSAIVSTSTADQWWIFDLTTFLKAVKASGQNEVTLVLRNLQRTVTTTKLSSKEASSNQPELIVTS